MAKKIDLMLPKGMSDLDPADKILQLRVLDTIREVFELYGYAPIETPLVERMDILTAKFAAGESSDIMKEIFAVSDQGDRELGLRFDHTVPLARYVAMNPSVKLPFKRYAIGPVFRDGPIKLGRYRQFWQADADVIGVPGTFAECEGILMAAEVFGRLGLDVTITFNSRGLLNEVMDLVGIPDRQQGQAVIAIDKLKKIGAKGVTAELKEAGVSDAQAQELLSLLDVQGSNADRVEALSAALPDSAVIADIVSNLELLSSLDNVVFEPSLARGLGYYTGFFFEAFLKDSQITSSLVGTGRYDKMIGQFSGGKHDFAGVGISFGVSVICDALREKGEGTEKSPTQVYVAAISKNEQPYALEIAQMLRAAGIKTDMDMLQRSPGKNFAFADAQGIAYVVIVGEDEQKDRQCSVKAMSRGEQATISIDDLVDHVS